MKLLIVESPGKIKTISSFLGKDYIVKASIGHIRDLANNSMSIDILSDRDKGYIFDPIFENLSDKKTVISELVRISKNVTETIIATDKDREGEAIGYHLAQVLGLKSPKRILFDEISSSAFKKALESPVQLHQPTIDAQMARRLMDRLVGYGISPTLGKGLSAGRVQSPVVRLLVDTDAKYTQELDKISSEYGNYDIRAIFENIDTDKSIHKSIHKSITIGKLETRSTYQPVGYVESKSFISEMTTYAFENMKNIPSKQLTEPAFIVSSIDPSITKTPPQKPFITSTLQQTASQKLGWNVKTIMSVAQKLYEKGYITYMRTDSFALSKDFVLSVKSFILQIFGESYFKIRISKNKANAQEAHEAIRPTKVENLPLTCKRYLEPIQDSSNRNGNGASKCNILTDLTPQEELLYYMIWKRTVEYMMSDSEYSVNKIIVTAPHFKRLKAINSKTNIQFIGEIKELIFDGYQILGSVTIKNDSIKNDSIKNDSIKNDSNSNIIFKVGQILRLKSLASETKYTFNHSHLNESSLIQKLEALGIGRPSTYATIVSTILSRNYVKVGDYTGKELDRVKLSVSFPKTIKKIPELKETKDKVWIGKETKKFIVTEIGLEMNEHMMTHFPDIVDLKFTAKMEKDLDKIANKKYAINSLLSDLWTILEPTISKLSNISKERCASVNQSTNSPEITDPKNNDIYKIVTTKTGTNALLKKWHKYKDMVTFINYIDEDIGTGSEKKNILSLKKAKQLYHDNYRMVGTHKAQPIFRIVGQYGPYLKYGKNTASLKLKTDDVMVSEGKYKSVELLEKFFKLPVPDKKKRK